eukprot:scaffold1853_cov367-Prasinococcus_capsulatus_cf.AAC.2
MRASKDAVRGEDGARHRWRGGSCRTSTRGAWEPIRGGGGGALTVWSGALAAGRLGLGGRGRRPL